MAIIRTKIIKLGVSFGSGCIKFGNDELAYVDALRAFPQDETYRAFRDACDAIDANSMAGEPGDTTDDGAGDGSSTSSCADAASPNDRAGTDAPAGGKPQAGDVALQEGGADATGTDAPALIPFEIAPDDEGDEEAPAEPEPDPTLVAAAEAARAFKETCSRLALSEMYEQMGGIIASLEQGVLPPVADLAKLDSDYAALVEYVSHH